MAEGIMDKKEFDERLIMEVEANPALYNKSEHSYSDRYLKEEEWQNISLVLNTDVRTCKERWKNLRDTFAKYHKKQKNQPSGSQALPNNKPWVYFEILKFLIPNVEVPRTFGNMGNESESSFVDLSEMEQTVESPTTSNKRPTKYVSTSPKPVKKKKKSQSDTDRFMAALTEMKEPESKPLEKFFLALAQQANSWSRQKQSVLEMRTLQLFHEIEFEDDL